MDTNKTHPWYDLQVVNGHVELYGPKTQKLPLTYQQLSALYTYSLQHQVVRVQFTKEDILLEHADGYVSCFNKVIALEEQNPKLVARTAPTVINNQVRPRKQHWSKISDPHAIVQAFPVQPTADEIIALFEYNKQLRSNLLNNFLNQLSSNRK